MQSFLFFFLFWGPLPFLLFLPLPFRFSLNTPPPSSLVSADREIVFFSFLAPSLFFPLLLFVSLPLLSVGSVLVGNLALMPDSVPFPLGRCRDWFPLSTIIFCFLDRIQSLPLVFPQSVKTFYFFPFLHVYPLHRPPPKSMTFPPF